LHHVRHIQGVKGNELVGLAHEQTFEKDVVDETENGRIRANGDGKRQNRGRGKGRMPAEHAKREPEIGAQFVIEPQSCSLARLLFITFTGPELQPRSPERFGAIQTVLFRQVIGASFNVKLDLLAQARLHPVAVHKISEP
jgi:hypothetical protein